MSRTFFGPISSRRQFIVGALSIGAATAAASALSGCKDTADMEWNEEADVIIVGAGGSGLTAAIEALRAGSSVILFEKALEAGGSTALSGGVIQAAGTDVQIGGGVTNDTPDKHYEYYEQAGEGVPTPELLRTLTDNAPAAVTFMQGLGLAYSGVYGVDPIPTVDPSVMIDRIHLIGEAVAGVGADHVAVLLAEVTALGGDLRTEAAVEGLIEDFDEGIVGVTVTIGGQTLNVRARQAVVIASGGFERNEDLVLAFSPQQKWEMETGVCYAAPTNTGDGLVMGMDVGADVAALGGTIGYPGVGIGTSTTVPGIWVNKHGQRFINEGGHYAYLMRGVYDQEEHMAWAVFDQTVADIGGAALGGFGGWSDDLSEEIASDQVITAATLEDLATALGVNASELERTVAAWNDDMADGTDKLFGKAVGLAMLNTAPYYAIQVTSINLGTCGGLKINTDTQVLDVYGQPIKRLYAAGMTTGGFIGPYYPGSGTAIAATVVFGRIAGTNAANEVALEPVKNLVEA